MIAKLFIIAKLFRAYSANFLRQDKSLHDHGDAMGSLMRSDSIGATDGLESNGSVRGECDLLSVIGAPVARIQALKPGT